MAEIAHASDSESQSSFSQPSGTAGNPRRPCSKSDEDITMTLCAGKLLLVCGLPSKNQDITTSAFWVVSEKSHFRSQTTRSITFEDISRFV